MSTTHNRLTTNHNKKEIQLTFKNFLSPHTLQKRPFIGPSEIVDPVFGEEGYFWNFLLNMDGDNRDVR